MDSKETHQQKQQQQQNRNAVAALASPASTSQAMHDRSSVGAFSLRQPQPQQARTLDASTQQPITYALPDAINSGGGANASNSLGSGPPSKRGRGRPPLGSQNRNGLGGGEGGPLTVHVIDVNVGENIAMKLLEFINQVPRDVCILSASGVVSSVVLQPNNPIRRVTLEGSYVIIDMSMSPISLKTGSAGTLIRTATLHVSLAGGRDAKIVGGFVGRMLVAASQVKVIVGTFVPEGGLKLNTASAPANVLSSSGGGGGQGFPQSQGPQRSSESSEESPLHQVGNSTPQPPHHHLSLWPGNNPQ